MSETSVMSVGSSATTPTTSATTTPSATTTRRDQRTTTQIRPIAVEYGLLARADGSVRYSQGYTTVLCAVHGPMAPTSQRTEHMAHATLHVEMHSLLYSQGAITSSLTGAGGSASASASYHDVAQAKIIQAALESVVLTHLHPRTTIRIVLQVVRDDGSLLACAINAAYLALVHAGVACSGMLSAVRVAVPASAASASALASTSSSNALPMVLDTIRDEEESLSQAITCAFTSTSDGVVTSVPHAMAMPESTYRDALQLARRACQHLILFYRASYKSVLQDLIIKA